MPWTGETFAAKHNHKLRGPIAAKAAEIADAMLKRGVPEGEVIATANKRGDAMMQGGGNARRQGT